MTRRSRSSTHPRLVLLVGGDVETARSCARDAAPLPVVRAKHVNTATSRLRSMKPVALIVASDVSRADIIELERVATEQAAHVVHLVGDEAKEALRRFARG